MELIEVILFAAILPLMCSDCDGYLDDDFRCVASRRRDVTLLGFYTYNYFDFEHLQEILQLCINVGVFVWSTKTVVPVTNRGQ